MNIAALLNYGPRLIANPVSERAGQKKCKRYSPKMIERYKGLSVNGMIWSTLIASNEGKECATIAKNLKEMADDGILEVAGKVNESRASNKPWLYRWK